VPDLVPIERSPFYASGIKVAQVDGADGPVAYIAYLVCIFGVYTWFPHWPALVFFLLIGAIMKGLRMMSKADPLMRKVWIRSFHYLPYYAPHGNLCSGPAARK